MSGVSGAGSANVASLNQLQMVQSAVSESLQMRNGLVEKLTGLQVENNVRGMQILPVDQKDQGLGAQVDVRA